ncbi:unnamed protein product [Didymodactylos carnosus]|uniref:Uncharacterized protein n=1 Tax=Didymodactylos carnosus TaxID=1234261 RepID=A0A813V193_9BILA|nr:unnamed protein product [Didymodactylos carnosus]CAF1201225.1 unnamed protein product [Didymodactylos carnosus]CAF3618009.1 unnamed protein product [Didymodactylos carnosus]CAF4011119.1 unnamed protein product [Didymodactylos carnosus]
MLTTNDISHATFNRFGYNKQFPSLSNYTCTDWKNKLSQLRVEREQELSYRVNECYRLRDLHKNQFDRCISSNQPTVPASASTPTVIAIDNFRQSSQDISFIKKYSIARIKYCPLLYTLDTNVSADHSQEIFLPEKYNNLVKYEKELPILKTLTQHISGVSPVIVSSASAQNYGDTSIPSVQLVNEQNKSSVETKRLSVSSVNTADKYRCIVYDQWPNREQVSKILGYKIEYSGTLAETGKKSKSISGKKSNRQTLTSMSKRVKREEKSKLLINHPITDLNPAVLESSPVIETNKQAKPAQSNLPDIIYPPSEKYSTTISIKRWLMKNSFCSGTPRTFPLL